MGAVDAARRIVADGTPESAWQRWPRLHRLPTLALDELVPAGARAIVVAPHPDDEVLAFGGLLAMLAARGSPISIIAVTDGDASHPGSPIWSPQRLALRRREESAEGLRRLGLGKLPLHRLGCPDGQVQRRRRGVTAMLQPLLRAGDRVFTTWSHDGHPDHEATALAVERACATVGAVALQAPVWMWHWAEPADPRVPWDQLYRLPLDAETQARKRAAIAAHQTQLTPQHDGRDAVLTPRRLNRLLRPAEYFFLRRPR
ncbi:PIG-L deacetylase family protein [Piscinibacter sakaiensis]|uniref:PIG-L deacetylase family protein n=1 Tax=Piscinibacter sakaiensis TaxID=1547922 RepID=UPI003AACB4E8